MKKILLALLASTAVGGVAVAQSFPDVPAGSYAEEAVARLADLGIVIGYPDGTYRGNEAFTRYQAALVVTRLLDTVEGEMLTDADLDTVRNALQELASDVAASEQAVSDLQAAIAGADGAESAAVEELQAQLDALTVELDTLTAAQDAAAGLEQQVQSNTDQIGQLNDLVGILNEDIAALGSGGEPLDTGFLDDIEQNTADIANLREFVVLLRRDQVGVTERVATIEESDTAQNARLDDITARVEALEGASVGFSGSIGLKYDVGRLSGDEIPFDVDRIFGVGQDREQPLTYFSGDFQSATDDLNDDDDEEDAGEEAQDRQDIEFQSGDFAPELTLNVDFSAARGIAPESGLNTFDASVALELSEATVLDADVDGADDGTPFDFTDPDNYFDGYVFEFNSFEATLGPIGADPINFYFGEDPGADFSDYVFESLGPGFRVEIGTPDFLAFLQPTLQIAYGTYENGGDSDEDTLELPDNGEDTLAVAPPGATDVVAPGAVAVANPWTDAYYRGLRGTLTPFAGEGFGLTGGFSVGQISGNADENADAANGGAGDNADITVYGLDGTLNLSILNVTFEYAQNDIGEGVYFQQNDDLLQNAAEETAGFDGIAIDEGDGIPVAITAESSTVYYAEATVDTEAAGIPLLQSLSANYRSVPEFWYGLKYDEDSYPWETDQVGYGAEATIGLSIFSITGFYDTYTIEGDETEPAFEAGGAPVVGNEIAAYGVELAAEVFRAVEVYGFYNIVTLDGQRVQLLEEADRNDEYTAGLGVGARHDGEAENALVPGLDFDVSYSISNGEFNAANLDSEFTLGGFTLSPYVDFSVESSNLVDSDDVRALEAGTGITTEPLDIILQPSFAANVNYRNATHTDVEDADDYVADVLQYSVGINFNQFLFENSTFGVRYGSFAGTNVEFDPNINGADDNASDISDGDQGGTGTQVTNGYEIVWNYYGLEFGYGAYFSGNGADTAAPSATGGQAFSILYTVNF